ncbi:MAG: histidine kinase N-terminal 7TM domain-containing protein, partial [Candidatus Thermoplasmatota archaeon]
MILYSIPSLVGAFVAITLGVIVLYKRLKDKPGRVFFFLMLACAIWCFGEFMMQNCKNIYEALIWAKVANLGFVLIPTFLVRFAFVYP